MSVERDGRCLVCRPVVRMRNGADHTGVDFFLRCMKCSRRTTYHVEGHGPKASPEIVKMLRNEWRSGRIAEPDQKAS